MAQQTPPSQPDFLAIEAAASGNAERQTMILALIGNLVLSWSNNESVFIYVLMSLLETDEVSAAIVFATLNTTRARLDLIHRLASVKVADKGVAEHLIRLTRRFDKQTKLRNEFNHCMYTLSAKGEITHTNAIRIHEAHGRIRIGNVRQMDQARIDEIIGAIHQLKELNRDLWAFLPKLHSAVRSVQTLAAATTAGGAKTDSRPQPESPMP